MPLWGLKLRALRAIKMKELSYNELNHENKNEPMENVAKTLIVSSSTDR
jgi:hypothetical protein